MSMGGGYSGKGNRFFILDFPVYAIVLTISILNPNACMIR